MVARISVRMERNMAHLAVAVGPDTTRDEATSLYTRLVTVIRADQRFAVNRFQSTVANAAAQAGHVFDVWRTNAGHRARFDIGFVFDWAGYGKDYASAVERCCFAIDLADCLRRNQIPFPAIKLLETTYTNAEPGPGGDTAVRSTETWSFHTRQGPDKEANTALRALALALAPDIKAAQGLAASLRARPGLATYLHDLGVIK